MSLKSWIVARISTKHNLCHIIFVTSFKFHLKMQIWARILSFFEIWGQFKLKYIMYWCHCEYIIGEINMMYMILISQSLCIQSWKSVVIALNNCRPWQWIVKLQQIKCSKILYLFYLRCPLNLWNITCIYLFGTIKM